MSGLDSGNRKDYSKYDRMSTESLEELLRLDAELPNGEESDIDEILYISEVIAKREKEHPTGRYSEMDVDAAWETFQTEYRPFVTEGRSLYDFDDDEPGSTETASPAPGTSSPFGKNRISVRGRRYLGRVASFAAAIAILLGLMTVTAYAMGYDLWGVIAQWTKDTFTFVSASKVSDKENPDATIALSEGEYGNLQAALDANGITEQLAPTWIPEGFSVELVTVDRTTDPSITVFQCDYHCDEKWIIVQIILHQDPNNVVYTEWQKSDDSVTEMEYGGCTFYVMKNNQREIAVWSNGPFECYITADVTSEELIDIIKSIFVRNE